MTGDNVDNSVASYGLYPLSALDVLFERTTFVTGWLVEGTINHVALANALRAVTEKWRMLAGRLVSQKVGDKKTEWYLRIPLGPLPPHDEYPTFSLTTTFSVVPITDYVPIPFTSPSPSFPPPIFIHPSTPRQFSVWEGTHQPLTCWHLTYFPARGNLRDYTCIGFSRSHGMFDGGGAAMVMHALVAEMRQHCQDSKFERSELWVAPPLPLPHPNRNINPVKACIEREIALMQKTSSQLVESGDDYSNMAVLGIKGALTLAAWHTREKWWRGARREIVILPKKVLEWIVEGVRKDIKKWREGSLSRSSRNGGTSIGRNGGGLVTTGDVLVAWLLKVIYSKGTSPDTIVNCSNLASFRHLIPSPEGDPSTSEMYPHNAFMPLPYPLFTVRDLQSIPLHELSYILNTARSSFSLHHVAQGYKLVTQSVTTFLVSPHAHENLVVSNVSASRILESDWSAVGGEKTVCGYRYQITPTKLLLTNSVFIAGRLEDGSTVLDATLSQVKSGLLVDAVAEWSEMVR